MQVEFVFYNHSYSEYRIFQLTASSHHRFICFLEYSSAFCRLVVSSRCSYLAAAHSPLTHHLICCHVYLCIAHQFKYRKIPSQVPQPIIISCLATGKPYSENHTIYSSRSSIVGLSISCWQQLKLPTTFYQHIRLMSYFYSSSLLMGQHHPL